MIQHFQLLAVYQVLCHLIRLQFLTVLAHLLFIFATYLLEKYSVVMTKIDRGSWSRQSKSGGKYLWLFHWSYSSGIYYCIVAGGYRSSLECTDQLTENSSNSCYCPLFISSFIFIHRNCSNILFFVGSKGRLYWEESFLNGACFAPYFLHWLLLQQPPLPR